jgi:hypothetical protein
MNGDVRLDRDDAGERRQQARDESRVEQVGHRHEEDLLEQPIHRVEHAAADEPTRVVDDGRRVEEEDRLDAHDQPRVGCCVCRNRAQQNQSQQ